MMGPYDHRGRPVGANYRSTPRLAKLMSRQMTRDMREASPLSASDVPEVTPSQAQRYLNEYRANRDFSNNGNFENTRNKANQIYSSLYSERNKY